MLLIWIFQALIVRKITAQRHKAILKCLLLVTLLLNASHLTAAPEKPTSRDFRFNELEVPELEKIGTQQSIIEDKQGFTWFGGFNGLARFDGYDVVTFKHDPRDPHSLSYNGVSDLLVDRKGQLWIATYEGLNRYDESTGQFIRYTKDSAFSLPTDQLTKIEEDLSGNIWVGTQSSGLIKINGESERHEPVPIKLPPGVSLVGNPIRALSLDSEGMIWVGVYNLGLFIFNPQTLELRRPNDLSGKTKTVAINIIKIGPDGNIWLGTSMSGLLRLTPETGEVKHYHHTPSDASSLHHNSIWDIYFDHQGLMWVAADDSLELYQPQIDGFKHFVRLPGTDMYGKVRALYQMQSGHFWLGMFPSGVAYLDVDATVFRHFVSIPNVPNSLTHTSVTAIAEDAEGNLWIGTEGGLDYLDVKNMEFKHYLYEYGNPHSLPSNAVLTLHVDSTDTLWVGTWKGGWARFDQESQKFFPAKMHDGSTHHMEEEIWDIYEDKQNQLWVGGLYLYDRQNDVFKHYTDVYPEGDRLSSSRINVLLEDQYGEFWIGTLAGINRLDRQTGEITYYQSSADPHSLSDDILMSAMEDEEGNLWFGTHGGGVNIYNREKDNFKHLGQAEGLYDDSITGMVDDHAGGVWLTSGSGLIHYKKDTEEFELFDHKNGLRVDLFHRNAIIRSSNNEIIFGGANGLAFLNPAELIKNTTIPPIVLTQFEVLNQTVTPISHPQILSSPINYTDDITLTHKHNVFTIHYSALNYRMPGQNRYAYKLEGFDKNWNEVGHVRRTTYTNLDPGQYIFKVRGSNNSGVWNNQGAELNIQILPPWWQTTYAYAFYVLFFLAIAYLVFYVLIKLKQARDQKTLNAQLKEVAELKDAFLANTSHELRTPLNGIIGLAESMITSPETISTEEGLLKLSMVVNSGKRLSSIINDILDFSKLRNHDIKLNKSLINLYDLVHTVITLSSPLIDKKSIQLTNNVSQNFPLFAADEQRLSQVLFNIVGNAIKFTANGKIEVSAESTGNLVKIKVKDSGIGINNEDFERIFLPFEQSTHKKHVVGTGLGLAVSKKLIELHGGTIQVDSSPGNGSTFTINLPLEQSTNDAPTGDQAPNTPLTQHPYPFHTSSDFSAHKALDKVSFSKNYHILIVDDEPVNRMVLEGYLKLDNYIISECANGHEALRLVESDQSIDMVLLDVMMPDISGYEVCKALRESHKLLELPILFLTAKSQKEDLTEGYQAGANDFLFKPIDKDELLAKIRMHLMVVEEHERSRRQVDVKG